MIILQVTCYVLPHQIWDKPVTWWQLTCGEPHMVNHWRRFSVELRTTVQRLTRNWILPINMWVTLGVHTPHLTIHTTPQSQLTPWLKFYQRPEANAPAKSCLRFLTHRTYEIIKCLSWGNLLCSNRSLTETWMFII